jgi:hypothetical protein
MKATMNDNDPSPALPLSYKRMRWRLFFVLWTASVVGMFLVLPYALAMIPAKISRAPRKSRARFLGLASSMIRT